MEGIMAKKQKRKNKGEIHDLAETTLELREHRKTIDLKNGDHIEIKYIPCPPEKIIAWHRSIELITKMILEILKEPTD
jgi:hypothetical protein